MIALVVALASFAFVGIFWARRIDRAEQSGNWADLERWHLLHGPTDGCPECEGK